MTDRVDINRVLMEIRSFKAQNQAMNSVQGVGNSLEGVNNTRGTQQVNGPRFGELLEQAVSKVNARAIRRREVARRFAARVREAAGKRRGH